jgi:hypothetical protein
MRKLLQLITALFFLMYFSCKDEKKSLKPIIIKEKETQAKVIDVPKRTLDSIGSTIEFDFSIDGTFEKATVVLIKEALGNPIEDGTPAEYEIQFAGKKTIESIKLNTNAILIDEGDLDNDGLSELSVCQEPMNGCTYQMTTYTFKNRKFKTLFEPFLIPTACEVLSNEILHNKVYKTKKGIYIKDIDANDDNFKTIEKLVLKF